MNELTDAKASRQVANWLLIGVVMIIIQVLIGGITRLTESGLSITEWKPITGALPPTNDAAWQAEFDKYKVTDQFKYIHNDFSLSDFKQIFFWEWLHRLWARLMGLVFLAGFIYFLVKKKFTRSMVKPMILLFVLGGLQGVIGWLMVKSGLVPEKYFVGHVELTTHFIAALGLLSYTVWFVMKLKVGAGQIAVNMAIQKFLLLILTVFILQLIYGAFMAGLKAGPVAPSWPAINGQMVPDGMNELTPAWKNLVNNPLAIHFIHRILAYLLLLLIAGWWLMSSKVKGNPLFTRFRNLLLLAVVIQATLGILTVINATVASRMVYFGATHQFMAMMLVVILTALLYIIRKRPLQ